MNTIGPGQLRFALAASAALQLSGITFLPVLMRTARPVEPPPMVQLRLLPTPPPAPATAQRQASAARPATPLEAPAAMDPLPVVFRAPEIALFEAPEVAGVVGGVEGGAENGVIGGIVRQAVVVAPPPALPPPPPPPAPVESAPPPPPPPPAPPERINVSPDVQRGQLAQMVRPDYPPMAKRARIQGTVRLRAVIARDGSVSQVDVVEGHPLLVEAALAAAAKWRYRPTLINGVPVEVSTFIEVNFRLVL